ncbi:hypothetical protein M427DRAFT_27548 [Gonapodya prolifera JEL478]|uniref:F-box domain-containing protein n=1 Tax=Gonapodya prolifera (strain JEL478) TaxID=1344416 RepID=A0A139AWI0_GONPJ|nr:hypothetical protein M427DRAFT_27548 [Gonapodya prolifera JEL478]|eukprot:KXS21096.1 hypothetical protein M427DRAFT_27548 [Gonapodya prolifera JEL478]
MAIHSVAMRINLVAFADHSPTELLLSTLTFLNQKELRRLFLVNKLWSEVSAEVFYSQSIVLRASSSHIFLKQVLLNTQSFHQVFRRVRSLVFDVKILGPTTADLLEWVKLESLVVKACSDTLRSVRFERSRGGISVSAGLRTRPVGMGISMASPRTLDIDCYLSQQFPYSYLSTTPLVQWADKLIINGMRPTFIPLPMDYQIQAPHPPVSIHLAHLKLCVSLGSEWLSSVIDLLSGSTCAISSLDTNIYAPAVLAKLANLRGLCSARFKYMYPDVLREMCRGNETSLQEMDLGEIIFAGGEWLDGVLTIAHDGTGLCVGVSAHDRSILLHRALSAIRDALGNDDDLNLSRSWKAEKLVFKDDHGRKVCEFTDPNAWL